MNNTKCFFCFGIISTWSHVFLSFIKHACIHGCKESEWETELWNSYTYLNPDSVLRNKMECQKRFWNVDSKAHFMPRCTTVLLGENSLPTSPQHATNATRCGLVGYFWRAHHRAAKYEWGLKEPWRQCICQYLVNWWCQNPLGLLGSCVIKNKKKKIQTNKKKTRHLFWPFQWQLWQV
jgi:hypothetical protein